MIRKLSMYLIVITVLEGLLPDRKYKSYFQFYAGLVFLIILISPVVNFFLQNPVTSGSSSLGQLEQAIEEMLEGNIGEVMSYEEIMEEAEYMNAELIEEVMEAYETEGESAGQ